jgi:uncharacterized protein YciI
MHYLLLYDVASDYLEKREPFRRAHLEHIRAAHERGDLVLAGALTEPADGAVLVFRGASLAPAEAFAKTDPYVTNGVVTKWQVRKWNTVIGDGATLPQV